MKPDYKQALKQILAWSIWAIEATQEDKEARLNNIRDECFWQLGAYTQQEQMDLIEEVKPLA